MNNDDGSIIESDYEMYIWLRFKYMWSGWLFLLL